MRTTTENRWTARVLASRLVQGAALLVPMAASFAAAVATQRVVDLWRPTAPWIVGALASLIVAMAVLVLGERAGRRLLPLAMLLKLSLVFPDQVPSRFSIALRAASPKRLRRAIESGSLAEAGAAERVLSLVTTLAAHDRRTRGHSERVRAVALLLADEAGITGPDRDKLEWAALLHDIGKLSVSPAILNKPGRPDEAEWAQLQRHPQEGIPLTEDLVDWMGEWVHAIDQHHEKHDGTGYPKGLSGNAIAKGARIVAVADAFEVMTAIRSYKRAMSIKAARAELIASSGTHFDPVVVRSFASLSVPRLHRSLGPSSWLLSLPFRSVAAPLMRGGSAVVGGSAPTALAGVTALFVMSITTVASAQVASATVPALHSGAEPTIEVARSVDAFEVAPEVADPTMDDPAASEAGRSADSDPVAMEPSVASIPATEPDRSSDPSPTDSPTPQQDDAGDPGTERPTGLPAAAVGNDGAGAVGIEPSVEGLSATVSEAAATVGSGLGSQLDTVVEGAVDPLVSTVDDVSTTVEGTVDDVAGVATGTLDSVGSLAEGAISPLTEVIDGVAGSAATVTPPLTSLVTESEVPVIESIADAGALAQEIEPIGEGVPDVAGPVTVVPLTVIPTSELEPNSPEATVGESIEAVTETLPTEALPAEPVTETLPTEALPADPVTETLPSETGPLETGPTETLPSETGPTEAVGGLVPSVTTSLFD